MFSERVAGGFERPKLVIDDDLFFKSPNLLDDIAIKDNIAKGDHIRYMSCAEPNLASFKD